MPTNKRLLGIGLAFIAACIFLFLAGTMFPRAIGFLDGVLCPDGMQLTKHSEQIITDEGNPGTSNTVICVGEGQAPVSATAGLLLIMGGLGVVATGFIVWGYGGIKRVK